MYQQHLPIFPDGMETITGSLGFYKDNGKVTYFNQGMPIFSHAEDDLKTFQLITAQFCVNSNCKQMDIVRAFGVTAISVKRSVKKYLEEGPSAFYKSKKGRGAAILTPEVLSKAQLLLNEGVSLSEIASQLQVKSDTLRKAVQAKKLHRPLKKKSS